MTQEEKHIPAMVHAMIQVREKVKKLNAENEDLKAKLEAAKEALRFYIQPRRGAFLRSDSDYEFYPNHDVALDALKEIEEQNDKK